ncbi:hypothetical protein [Devosia algicola]|uniref:hypothetical protein n=1 Tax=Devosia algicola TaxID=3026418 RepID=UPI002E1FD762
MGLSCVVEGVETHEELTVVAKLGGQYIQGYLYSAPVREAEVAGFIAELPQALAE